MSRHFSAADLPATVPVFPLSGALLLPRARLPLNIFEPRYLAMIDDALKTEERLIGMVQPADEADPPGLRRIGCAGRLVSFSETDDGRYMIILAGVARYQVTGEVEGFAPYRRAQVDWRPFARDLGRSEADEEFDRPRFLKLLSRYFEASRLSTDWDSLEEADEETLVNSLSMLCPHSTEEKQALLEAPSLAERRRSLAALMEFAIASHGEDGSLQ